MRNFGKNGATVMLDSFDQWARGFAKQAEYTNALAFQPVVANVSNLIRQAAAQKRADTVDLFAPLAQHPEWFPDKLHPNSNGVQRIAEVVARCLQQEPDAPVSSVVLHN